jgi:hypothetical protein
MITLAVVLAAGVAAVAVLSKSHAGRIFLKYRGNRLVSCPETHAPAAVRVGATWAAVTAPFGLPRLRLKSCSRWPDRQDCEQPCLWQIRAAPRDTLVSTVLRRWYEGKRCVVCRKCFDATDWLQHEPCALSPDSRTADWHDVAPQRIPTMLATHLPVCWNCHIVETFRREHPDLVVDR